jgi:hypothetical protein
MKFCFNLEQPASQTHEMLMKAFCNNATSRTQIFEWHTRFKSGQTVSEDFECSGHTLSSGTEKIVEKSVKSPMRTDGVRLMMFIMF